MKNTFGNNISVTVFGESHGAAIGCIIDGLTAGIPLDTDLIQKKLDLRKPQGKISTARKEADRFKFLSGFFNGHTTGTPLTVVIENTSQKSKDYEKTKNLLRPSHADYTAFEKYHGFQDYRGGGHFSGRITAPIVAAGAICEQILNRFGIEIGCHIAKLGHLEDDKTALTEDEIRKQFAKLNGKYFPVFNDATGKQMIAEIERLKAEKDSVGGILETVVIGLPTGIGEPFFDSVESVLAHLYFAIPGIKGVEFGLGFGFAGTTGSTANDAFCMNNGEIRTVTNNNGGINGGITNGMPITARLAVKPTPSVYRRQNTVDYRTKTETTLEIEGRHDPTIIHRARVVAESMTAIGILDLLSAKKATDSMFEIFRTGSDNI